MRAHASTLQQRVETLRTTSPGLDAAFAAGERDRAVSGNLLACAVAYRLFFWMLPVALLVSAGLGFAKAAGDQAPEQAGDDLRLGQSVVAVVADAAEQAERSRWIVLVIGLAGLYSAGAAGAKTIRVVHGLAWGEPVRAPRRVPLASAAFSGAALAAIVLTFAARWMRETSPGLGLASTLAIIGAYAALWFGVSLLLPHADAPWARLVPGAIFLGGAAQLLHLVTVYYLAGKIQTASDLYGGMGVAAVVLLGLFLLARTIIAAAVLNAALWERSQGRAMGGGAITRRG